ncbi:hypothetical protein [Natronomonas gomsonensis]|uniref:hypothetical protein n=1 Tax=Natronomonas gomsonensis TaxID=1046043 RepID=UPI0015B81220|nr:hypothetical protein [Natronomonas gomsonensis]
MVDISLAQIFLGFLATLIATLIGVERGFKKDRQAERDRARKTTLQHLNAIENELELNHSNAGGNYELIDELQQKTDIDSDHYSLEPYSTDAWDAAVSDQVIENISSETYTHLQETYSLIKSTNEQIRRLRTESLHENIGNTIDYGATEMPVWTMEVSYWNRQSSEVDTKGLGELIRDRSNRIRVKASGDLENIEQETENLRERLGDGANSERTAKGFHQTAAENYRG